MPKFWDNLKMINFPFGTNGKLIILGVPILKHITVFNKIKETIFYYMTTLVSTAEVVAPLCHWHWFLPKDDLIIEL